MLHSSNWQLKSAEYHSSHFRSREAPGLPLFQHVLPCELCGMEVAVLRKCYISENLCDGLSICSVPAAQGALDMCAAVRHNEFKM